MKPGTDADAKMDLACQGGSYQEKGLCSRVTVESVLHRLGILGLQVVQPPQWGFIPRVPETVCCLGKERAESRKPALSLPRFLLLGQVIWLQTPHKDETFRSLTAQRLIPQDPEVSKFS